jgi:hypothetical protein
MKFENLSPISHQILNLKSVKKFKTAKQKSPSSF